MSTSGPTKKPYHHGGLREALIEAALTILEEDGLAALSLRETARRAGVSAMAPYRHFADKEALLAGIATVGFERFADALREADRATTPAEALQAQGVAYVRFACANPALFRLMFGNAVPKCPGKVEPAGASAYAVLTGRVASLVPEDQAGDWSLVCWSLVHGLTSLVLDGLVDVSAEPAAAMVERMLRLVRVPG